MIVVRHAEKADQTPDTALSPRGRARAKALADLLRGAGVTHVITSEYQRARDRAAPLATALGLTVEQVPARDLPALVARLRALDPASIVVVVGHTNTIPPMLTVLGWPNTLELREGDYDNVFVLAPHPGQRASMGMAERRAAVARENNDSFRVLLFAGVAALSGCAARQAPPPRLRQPPRRRARTQEAGLGRRRRRRPAPRRSPRGGRSPRRAAAGPLVTHDDVVAAAARAVDAGAGRVSRDVVGRLPSKVAICCT